MRITLKIYNERSDLNKLNIFSENFFTFIIVEYKFFI